MARTIGNIKTYTVGSTFTSTNKPKSTNQVVTKRQYEDTLALYQAYKLDMKPGPIFDRMNIGQDIKDANDIVWFEKWVPTRGAGTGKIGDAPSPGHYGYTKRPKSVILSRL
jgi:hypothetical protein